MYTGRGNVQAVSAAKKSRTQRGISTVGPTAPRVCRIPASLRSSGKGHWQQGNSHYLYHLTIITTTIIIIIIFCVQRKFYTVTKLGCAAICYVSILFLCLFVVRCSKICWLYWKMCLVTNVVVVLCCIDHASLKHLSSLSTTTSDEELTVKPELMNNITGLNNYFNTLPGPTVI